MSSAPVNPEVAAQAAASRASTVSPPQPNRQMPPPPPQHAQAPGPAGPAPPPPAPTQFDDIFRLKFVAIIEDFKMNPNAVHPLTSQDRKQFIDTAFAETDAEFYSDGRGGERQLSDLEIKLRAITKVFYKVLAEEPWSEEWIRPQDVERKLSRFEMHKDSIKLAKDNGCHTVRDAVRAARRALADAKDLPPGKNNPRGPWDEIECIFVPGTVSSTATAKINRDSTYPVSVASIAHTLQNHICREMTRPYQMAKLFVTCTDTDELTRLRQFACNVCDFAPHLLDNDNCSLLVVLLILSRSEICRRFDANGIRIEGSTVSHRKAECVKHKLQWKTADERKAYDTVASELQIRVKNACFPPYRAHLRQQQPPPRRASNNNNRRDNQHMANGPPIGYFAAPQINKPGAYPIGFGYGNGTPILFNPGPNTGINVAPPPPRHSFGAPAHPVVMVPQNSSEPSRRESAPSALSVPKPRSTKSPSNPKSPPPAQPTYKGKGKGKVVDPGDPMELD